MSETSDTPGRVEQELQRFPGSSVTVRALTALFGVLPGATPPEAWVSVEHAAPSLDEEEAAAVRAALASDGVGAVLDVAEAVDRSDRRVLSGVSALVSGLFGGRPSNADPQRADAAAKARSLAYVVGRLGGDDVPVLLADPVLRPLLQYFAVAEIAVPLADEAASGSYIASLVEGDRRADWRPLRRVVGKAGVAVARGALPRLVPVLERRVAEVLPHAQALVRQVQSVVPGL
ncbi:MAG: hypothetical protein AAF078_14690, partial [Planctomycetota bacterium]